MTKKYRKKPVVVEAVQFNYSKLEDIRTFLEIKYVPAQEFYYIETLEGKMRVNPGDWIIKGTHGEFYPIREDIFTANYEEVK